MTQKHLIGRWHNMSYTAIISLLVMLAFLGVSTVAYGGISLFIIVPIIIATGFLVKEVS